MGSSAGSVRCAGNALPFPCRPEKQRSLSVAMEAGERRFSPLKRCSLLSPILCTDRRLNHKDIF